MSGQRIVLIGATGMVGGEALDMCLERPDVATVTVIGRRSCGRASDKLREHLHEDFMSYESLHDALSDQDGARFCLGAYTGAVADDLFRKITVDFALAFGAALRERSPAASFCLLSGQGADRSERARAAFARYKGAAENGLIALKFPRLYLFRPGYIYPVQPRREPNAMYRVARALYPVLRRLAPNASVTSRDLAGAMLHAALYGVDDQACVTLENADIRALARRIERG